MGVVLMNERLVPLSPVKHSALRLLPVTSHAFAAAMTVAPIILDEIGAIARSYPIVFPVSSSLPVALFGLETGCNAYVAQDGRWLAPYIPAHIRQHPFSIARVPGRAPDTFEWVVLLDESSSLLSATEGHPLFEADGHPAPALQQRLQLLEQLKARASATAALVQAIEQAGLLVERPIRIHHPDGSDEQVGGLRVVHESALNQLDGSAFLALRQTGALPLIYASLLSWANFQQGPIGRSHPLTASAALRDRALGGVDQLTGL